MVLSINKINFILFFPPMAHRKKTDFLKVHFVIMSYYYYCFNYIIYLNQFNIEMTLKYILVNVVIVCQFILQ